MYQSIILPHFKRQFKRHTKKYRHLKEAVIDILEHFEERRHTHVGHNIYKVRLRARDIQKGKSKSFRLLLLVVEVEGYIVPITLYFKGDRQDMSKKEINDHLEIIIFELRVQKLLK